MNDDVMKIDPNTLEQTIHSIEKFINKEVETLNEYKNKMNALSSVWEDATGFDQIIDFVNNFVKKSVGELGSTKNIYKKFLLNEIDDIRFKLAAIGK